MMQCSPPQQEKSEWRRATRAPSLLAPVFVLVLAACNGNESSAQGSNQLDELRGQRIVGGEAERGRVIIAAYECGVCHIIPGVQGAHGVVGPSLTNFAERQFIGGVVPNQPTLLVRWVQDAPSMAPHTGMPNMRLTDDEARHVAAYLYTLR